MIIDKIIRICVECGEEFNPIFMHCDKCHLTAKVDLFDGHDCKRSSDV